MRNLILSQIVTGTEEEKNEKISVWGKWIGIFGDVQYQRNEDGEIYFANTDFKMDWKEFDQYFFPLVKDEEKLLFELGSGARSEIIEYAYTFIAFDVEVSNFVFTHKVRRSGMMNERFFVSYLIKSNETTTTDLKKRVELIDSEIQNRKNCELANQWKIKRIFSDEYDTELMDLILLKILKKQERHIDKTMEIVSDKIKNILEEIKAEINKKKF